MLKKIVENAKNHRSENILEAKMLDISIKTVNKFATNPNKCSVFLSEPVDVYQKTDGVKITLIRTDTSYDNTIDGFYRNWVVAYKNNILFHDEYNYATHKDIHHTVGASQFSVVLKHFLSLHIRGALKSIKKNTEYLIEFLMKKPTLSSNYKTKHGMVLIGYARSSYKIKNGKVTSTPKLFKTIGRESIASVFDIDVPMHVFSGVLGDFDNFQKNIIDTRLAPIFLKYKASLESAPDSCSVIDIMRNVFIELESVYGGNEEGVVITAKNKSFNLKFQQDYQVDQKARQIIKMKHRMDAKNNEIYWENVRNFADGIIKELDIKMGDTTPLRTLLSRVSNLLTQTRIDIDFKNSKKTMSTIVDDIQLTIKSKIIRMLAGNNGALIIGKFRVLTNAHTKMINDALKKYDTVNVAIISNKNTKKNLPVIVKMIGLTFGSKINVAFASTGNIITLLGKFDDNINTVIAGTDRVEAYKKQLLRSPDMNIEEIVRKDIDIMVMSSF